ncbi:hypothetical protein [Paenibacillus silviterrae]|uniref:hypothetical protein n=1 Tax=Paenibacillus silviterrae TaxID=3242194 RepID=UPI002543DB69|nr:hypothetical protein [Paenibacillus chinjuensis]
MALHDLRTTSWVSMNDLVLTVISFPIMDSSRETESCAIVLFSTWTVVTDRDIIAYAEQSGGGAVRGDRIS